jgi:hypothetical protein
MVLVMKDSKLPRMGLFAMKRATVRGGTTELAARPMTEILCGLRQHVNEPVP